MYRILGNVYWCKVLPIFFCSTMEATRRNVATIHPIDFVPSRCVGYFEGLGCDIICAILN